MVDLNRANASATSTPLPQPPRMSPTPPNAPFFIVGCPRSGTTMFRLMLNEHSRLCVPRESFFISALMDTLPLTDPLSPHEVDEAIAAIIGHRRWAEFGLSTASVQKAVRGLSYPRLEEVVSAVFRLACGRKPRWGDKTPAYGLEIRRLAIVFPGAKFIHLVRDCRDVCRSMHDAGWHGKNWNRLAAFWRDRVAKGILDGRALGPDRYCEVRYEDLVLDPAETLSRTLAFLGEPMEDSVHSFHERAANQLTAGDHRLHAKTMRAPSAADVERWRHELVGLQVAAIEFVAGRIMTQAGQRRHFRGMRRALGIPAWAAMWAAEWSRPARRRLGWHLPHR